MAGGLAPPSRRNAETPKKSFFGVSVGPERTLGVMPIRRKIDL
jgi:hypothetical protein